MTDTVSSSATKEDAIGFERHCVMIESSIVTSEPSSARKPPPPSPDHRRSTRWASSP